MSLTKLLAKIDWSEIGLNILTQIGKLILISLFFYLLNIFGQKLISGGMSRYQKAKQSSLNRVQTLTSLLKNILRYTLMLLYVYTVLNLFGIPVGTLIASAGIASLAIGLGAQGFVSDIVTGFFILFEQQLQVDDFVTIADISGTVVSLGLRTTQLRGIDGTLHYIPNRHITIVSNFSRGHRQQLINLRITAQTDIKKLVAILTPINHELYQQQDDLLAEPQLLGTSLNDTDELIYQIQIDPKQGAELTMQRLLLDHYLPALNAAGIKLPQPVLNLQAKQD